MQLCLDRNLLLKALSHVQSIVERKHTMAILANVKIQCDGDSIVLTATDMDISVRETLASVGQKAFEAVTVPVHTLHEIVRKLPDGSQVNISSADNGKSQVVIKAGLSNFTLPCLSADEFPNFEVGVPVNTFNIEAKDLYSLLQRTKHAVSYEETRYYLTGTYLHVAESNGSPMLRAVATDTHRLALIETALPHGAENMPGIIIPRKTTLELIKLLEGHDGEVKVEVAVNKATFIIGATVLTSKLIDGKFPDYNSVIPINNDKTLEVARVDLARAIDLVISVSEDKTRAARLNIKNDSLTISANSEANGNAHGSEVLDASYQGNDIGMGFNSRYVLDALSTIKGDIVRFNIGEEGNAVVLKDLEDASCLHILMPMQG